MLFRSRGGILRLQRAVFRLEGNINRGQRQFAVCAGCHGADGNGTPQGNVPVIAGQHQRVIIKQLIDYRHSERWDPQMEQVADRHTLKDPQDIADVGGFISSLQRAARQGQGDGANVAHGKSVYLRDCADCHGAEGEGNGVTLVPRLAGQHYRYLLRQLHDTVEERRPNMPPPHRQLFGTMAVEDYTGIADYLSRVVPVRRIVR